MNFKHLFALVAIVAITFVGCKKNGNDVDNTKPATFKLEQTSLEFTSDGGHQTVNYSIENPVQGGVVLTDCPAEWVKDLSTQNFGAISFTVAPNYTRKVRTTTINVTYTGVDEAFKIDINQAASEAKEFTYKVVLNEPQTLVLDITPADKERAYICGTYSKAHIEAFNLESDVALFNYHLQALGYEAARVGQSLLNYLHNVSHVGDAMDIEFKDLKPDTEYIVFCYHIDTTTATIQGDIYRESVRTSKPTQADVKLTMTLSVQNNAITQKIESSNAEAYYYTSYWKVQDFKNYFGLEAKMEEVFPNRWNEGVINQIASGKSLNQIIEESCKKGSQTIENSGLANYTDYVFYLFAIDPTTGFAASDPIIATATTTSVQDSGETIEITVENVMAHSAKVYWEASSKSLQFMRSVFTKAEFDALGSSDDARFESIKRSYSFYLATGSTDMDLYDLQPNTTYIAFAYGVDGEAPNTRIFTKEFTTLSDTPGKSNILISWNNFYSLGDLATKDTEHWGEYAGNTHSALIPATISGVSSSDTVYIMCVQKVSDYYNTIGATEEQVNAQWLRDVVQEKNKVECYKHYNFVIEYFEKDYTIVAVAQDANGNFGTICKLPVLLYASDAADTASYVYKENK